MKKYIVFGASGFIGNAMSRKLSEDGQVVLGVDRVEPKHSLGIQFATLDLRETGQVYELLLEQISTLPKGVRLDIFQFAAEMGGAEYIFSGSNDFEIMSSSIKINTSIATSLKRLEIEGWPIQDQVRLFFSSSACIYPQHLQLDPENVDLREEYAYPANPDSEYGWEKLFSERLYQALSKDTGIEVRIARYHNIYGPGGAWSGGREKAPAAICRKVAVEEPGGTIEIFGTGTQTRSFLFIDDCLDATLLLMDSDIRDPLNIGSEEMVSINQLAEMVITHSSKTLSIQNVDSSSTGVKGRTSNNERISKELGWKPSVSLSSGIAETYSWVLEEVSASLDG